MRNQKLKLDLSERKCNVCDRPMEMDLKKNIMICVYYGCKIKRVEFSIPAVQDFKI